MSLERTNVTKSNLHRSSRVGTIVKLSDSSPSGSSTVVSRQFIGDSFDQYFDSIGLVKKVMANNNGSSVYRAVCESLSNNQSEHKSLKEFVEGELLFRYRLQRIRNGLPTVDKVEDTLKTLARLLGIELHVYRAVGEEPVVYRWSCVVDKPAQKVMLCESYRGHYDLVITRQDHINLAYAQSFVYDVLYCRVFGFSRDVIKECIMRVRNDMDSINMDNKTPPSASIREENDETSTLKPHTSTWRPPMPYCAIKCLDPSVYRNIPFELYLKGRRRERRSCQEVVMEAVRSQKLTSKPNQISK